MSRKVCLIEPRGIPGRPYNAWLGGWPLLGPVILATILRRRGFDAWVYNENISGSLLENPDARREAAGGDVVGLTMMTATANRAYRIAEELKRDNADLLTVLGGVHATFRPDEALAHADVVVRGEGENVIESIAGGQVDRAVVEAPPVEDLDSIPTPDFSLVRDFCDPAARRGGDRSVPVMSSRGCPYGCTFCVVSRMFGHRLRRQSPGVVARDVERYREQGFRKMLFYDDNFTASRRWTKRLLRRLVPLDVKLDAEVRIDAHWQDAAREHLDTELLDLMRRAGVSVLFIGYETVEDTTADRWHKGYRGAGSLRSRMLEDTEILHSHGFWTHGMFMAGPEHTRRSLGEVLDFVRAAGIESVQISILTPFPGTPLFERMRSRLVFSDFPRDWDFYDGAHCVYQPTRTGPVELQKAVVEAHDRYYRTLADKFRQALNFLRRPSRLPERLARIWRGAGWARETLREWGSETERFLKLLRSRMETRVAGSAR